MANITVNPIAYQIDELDTSGAGSSENPVSQVSIAPVTRASWNITNLPDGLSFNSQTHTISGRPTTVGTVTAILTIDTNWGTATQEIIFNITEGE